MSPPATVLKHFGVRVLTSLGGRLNVHWLVERRNQQLVLRRWSQPPDEIAYEVRLVESLATLGWPVAPVVEGPLEHDESWWSLALFLVGEPRVDKNSTAEQRERGWLLATFHADLAQLDDVPQRGKWRRCEVVLDDPTLDQLLNEHERMRGEEAYILRWHLHRAREQVAEHHLHNRAGMIIHGDWTTWNLLFSNNQLSGILDFELVHWDHRIGDFALSWRGTYDEVIRSYHDISPLEPEEWALLTPMWWAFLVEAACHDIRQGIKGDGWIIKQLLRRSPLMGMNRSAFRW